MFLECSTRAAWCSMVPHTAALRMCADGNAAPCFTMQEPPVCMHGVMLCCCRLCECCVSAVQLVVTNVYDTGTFIAPACCKLDETAVKIVELHAGNGWEQTIG